MSAPQRSGEAGALRRLFTSQTSIDFIGRTRTWAALTGVLLALAGIGLGVRGLNFSIEFTGGTSYLVEQAGVDFDADELRSAVLDLGMEDVTAQTVGGGDAGFGALVTTPEIDEIGGDQQTAVRDVVAAQTGVDPSAVDVSTVGPRWGAAITQQALLALGVFLGLTVLYITIRFEVRAAITAFVSLLHDVVVTVGIYALFGFQISPASVIALLTILGYSLYDSIIVFDRIKDDTRQLTATATVTYGEAANGALNAVLLRSLSTSVSSLMPVAALLVIGAGVLGADTLQDLALALFIGMAVGIYSSLVIATPLLVILKEREPRYRELRDKLYARRGPQPLIATSAAGVMADIAAGGDGTGEALVRNQRATEAGGPSGRKTSKSRAKRKQGR